MPHLEKATEKMNKTIDFYLHELNSIRTGRANPTLLDEIYIDYYGTPTPLNQLAQIAVVEGTQLLIKPFDISALREMEKAINMSNLSLPVQNDGNCLRINLPKLTEERRKELVKDVQKRAETAKVFIRNARRDINDDIKKDEELSEDGQKMMLEKVQKLTDDYIKKVDELTANKAEEITTI